MNLNSRMIIGNNWQLKELGKNIQIMAEYVNHRRTECDMKCEQYNKCTIYNHIVCPTKDLKEKTYSRLRGTVLTESTQIRWFSDGQGGRLDHVSDGKRH
jgi:hypothetical protein